MTPEGKVKAQIRQYLDAIGAYHFWPVQSGYGAATVDCLACVNGRWVAIEVKRPGVVEATPRQRRVLAKVHEAGGFGFVTDSLTRTKKMIEDHVLGKYRP